MWLPVQTRKKLRQLRVLSNQQTSLAGSENEEVNDNEIYGNNITCEELRIIVDKVKDERDVCATWD